MRFFYLDPGLQSNVRHNASTCRAVISELHCRSIETFIAASIQLIPELKTELGAVPLFQIYTYAAPHPDPIAGWLKTFLDGVAFTAHDLGKLPAPTAADVVFLNSAQPIQLMAVMTWLNGVQPSHRPRVVVEFSADLGVKLERSRAGYTMEMVDPREDPRSALFRHAGNNIPADFRGNLFLATFDVATSRVFQKLLEYETGVLPPPQQALRPLQRKAGRRPITIGVLGYQRAEKGYELMPEIIPTLLARYRDVQFLVHNPEPQDLAPAHEKIRKLATNDPRIVIDERPADDRLWPQLLVSTDIVLCPYVPARYETAHSALAVDALANGLPIVAPAHTTLQRFTIENNGATATFDQFAQAPIIEALSKAIDTYDELAAIAFAAAEVWNRQDRKALFVDAILGSAPSRS